MRTQIWSSGGGTQSTAIAVLIAQGKLPKPDLAVIVDTEREMSTTWDYMEQYTLPALAMVGVELHRVKKSDYATVDLFGGKGKTDLLIPAFTDQSGEIGKLSTYCSNEWKVRVMQRWATEQGVTAADNWIGYTIDEMRRVKPTLGKWQKRFPLIELRMTRGDCIALVENFGWPTPPRSSCYMCPNHTHEEWEWQKKHAPNDYQKAINFEIEIRSVDGDVWLTDTGKPLSEADFSEDDLFAGRCSSGMCFT